MSISWQHRIKHIDRRVKPTRMRGLRLQLLKSDVRERRGLPSGNLPHEYVMASVRLRFKGGGPREVQKLEWLKIRSRLLERKRHAKSRAEQRRRPSIKGRLNLFRARREWLEAAEQLREGAELRFAEA
ncbi:hypothetical protein F6X40_34730 [Paraburkholderia sp. UCT31]|uniref:hypothetical protein n=1 Tax=Paraburkholderia sp. UCT31 TaxID=2615209 RepID=UPI0016552733|nr:hypothetical protein [Paraburkholderia sp. UCT31]MBC8741718.1 hypothetical protein [Paraburkholderia sp. UCT31]